MDLKELFTLCSMICDKHIDKNPNACVSLNGTKHLYTDIKQDLENLLGWCYPMDTKEIKKCVMCSKCRHYTPTNRLSQGRTIVTYVCDLDKMPKKHDHYCGYGEEKDDK